MASAELDQVAVDIDVANDDLGGKVARLRATGSIVTFDGFLKLYQEDRDESRRLRKAVKVERRDVLAERKDEAAAKVTFREAARQYHAENEASWKSAVYARQWPASLENHAFAKRIGRASCRERVCQYV